MTLQHISGHKNPVIMRKNYHEKLNEERAKKVVKLIDKKRGTNKITNKGTNKL